MVHQEFDPSAPLESVRAGEDVDLIRTSVELVLQSLIEAEAADVTGAASYERTGDRQNYRNGRRLLSTKAGDVELQIPKLRPGAVRGRDGGVRARGLDAKGRRPGEGARGLRSRRSCP